MNRPAAISLLTGALAVGLALALGHAAAPALARSALAGWIVVAALPLGALPILMVLELAEGGTAPGTGALRLLVAGLPVVALLGALLLLAPVLAPGHVDLASLYGWSAHPPHGPAAAWFQPRWFAIRAVTYLVVWVALGLVFARPADLPSVGRRRLAAVGLGLHLVIGTLAALDWILSLDLGLNSPVFGLLVIALQCAFATTAALLVALAGDRALAPPRALVLILLSAVAAATTIEFIQYLVVWSANLPREITWYQSRFAGLGAGLFIAAPFVLAAAFAVMMPVALSARRGPVAAAAILLFGLELANLFWLVTPSWRGSFTLPPLDGLALVAVGGLALAGGLHARSRGGMRHG